MEVSGRHNMGVRKGWRQRFRPESLRVVGIDDKDKRIGVVVIVLPERTYLILATYVPDGHVEVFVPDVLNVETNGGNRCQDLAKF